MTGSDMDTLQLKLAEDCAKEEYLSSKKRLSDFKPCKETLHYLSKNDVRPLKKVLVTCIKFIRLKRINIDDFEYVF